MNKQKRLRVGIMGGTFDPIHYGHLYIAECSRYRFDLHKVLFIPTGQPVHKKRDNILDSVHRVEMTRLAIAPNPHFEISTIEVDRPGPTYTVDTLEQLYHSSGGNEEYYFITGADAIMEILTWKDVDRVFELCRFIAVTRPGYAFEAMNRVLDKISHKQREHILFYETSGILISSTEIRTRLMCGEPVTYLLPQEVEEYIEKQKLYRPEAVV